MLLEVMNISVSSTYMTSVRRTVVSVMAVTRVAHKQLSLIMSTNGELTTSQKGLEAALPWPRP